LITAVSGVSPPPILLLAAGVVVGVSFLLPLSPLRLLFVENKKHLCNDDGLPDRCGTVMYSKRLLPFFHESLHMDRFIIIIIVM
jgi:hypothetical protein